MDGRTIYLKPDKEGNQQFMEIEGKDNLVTITYRLMHSTGTSYIPTHVKTTRFTYNPKNVKAGIDILTDIETNTRSMTRLTEPYLPQDPKSYEIRNRVNNLRVNGHVEDRYKNSTEHTQFTLEDALYTLQGLPISCRDEKETNLLQAARYDELLKHMQKQTLGTYKQGPSKVRIMHKPEEIYTMAA